MGYYNVNECNGAVCNGKNLQNVLSRENNEETKKLSELFRNRFQQQDCWQTQLNECWEQENGQSWLT